MTHQKDNAQEGYTVHRTDQWSWEELSRYKEALNAAMQKYARRFPDDVCLGTVAQEIAHGRTQLWLILKESTQLAAFAVTKVERTHTGKKRVVLLDLAGEGGLKLVPLMDKLEEWARDMKADEVQTVGRSGWAKMLARRGYTINLIHYRKVLLP